MCRKKKNAPAATGATQWTNRPNIQCHQYTVFLEWRQVLRDVRVGALPLRALPGFLLWLIRGGGAA